jgi:DNA-binding PadR family transcriptional regulator
VAVDPESFLPLTPAVFYVLVALAAGDKHGYAILKEVRRQTDGRVTLNVGTLYAVLKRLEQDGLIGEAPSRPAPSLDDERRRYFSITALGEMVAAAEARRMERAIALARGARLIPKVRT